MLNCTKVAPNDKKLVPISIIHPCVWYVCSVSTDNSRTDVNEVAISLDSVGAEVVSVSVFATRTVIVTGDNICIGIKRTKACDHVDVDRSGVDREIEPKS